MSYNGSGVALINSTGQPVSANTLIEASVFNAFTADVATMLSTVICRDGQTTVTANLPMATYRHTGVGNASARTDYAAAGQVQDGNLNWVDGGGTADAITATYSPAITALVDGQLCCVRATAANATTTPTFAPNGLTARTIVRRGGGALVAGSIAADGHELILRYDLANTRWEFLNSQSVIGADVEAYAASASQVEMEAGTEAALRSMSPLRIAQAIAALGVSSTVPVRQTVLSGPVDSSGNSAFVGSTGSTTVTATATLKATAAAGGDANYTGSIVNPSWTSLSTNGTMYLFLDITSAGVVTTGSTTLAPVYQWGGTYSTTNLQNTFNIQEMTMKVGNGATATQVYRTFVGEVTVAGNVVTAITWYSLMGRYDSGYTATLTTGSVLSKNSNLGVSIGVDVAFEMECTTADLSYSVGDIVRNIQYYTGVYMVEQEISRTRNTVFFYSNTNPAIITKAGSSNVITAANWKWKFIAKRNW